MERNRTMSGLGNLPDRRVKVAKRQLAKHQTAPVSDQNPRGIVPMVTLPPTVHSLRPPMRVAALTDTLNGQRTNSLFWAVAIQYAYN